MQCALKVSRCAKLLQMQDGVKQYVRRLALSNGHASKFEKLFPDREEFQTRHIGPGDREQQEMLDLVGFKASSIFLFGCFHLHCY